jgi:hypothetical protein
MAEKLTRLTHKIAIQLHLVAESCTICSSRSRRLVRKLMDTQSYEKKFLSRFPMPYFPHSHIAHPTLYPVYLPVSPRATNNCILFSLFVFFLKHTFP